MVSPVGHMTHHVSKCFSRDATVLMDTSRFRATILYGTCLGKLATGSCENMGWPDRYVNKPGGCFVENLSHRSQWEMSV
jgi:hypothetical protein